MVSDSAAPWAATCQTPLCFTISWNVLKLMSIESVMPSNHPILCRPLLLPSIFPSIRIFSNESALGIRWPKYWSINVITLDHFQENYLQPPANIATARSTY